jgi:hypothetical protein
VISMQYILIIFHHFCFPNYSFVHYFIFSNINVAPSVRLGSYCSVCKTLVFY